MKALVFTAIVRYIKTVRGSYEKAETLKMLDGLIDIYLPDLKYYSSELSRKYSCAEDYFFHAGSAIAEMVRQTGTPVFSRKG